MPVARKRPHSVRWLSLDHAVDAINKAWASLVAVLGEEAANGNAVALGLSAKVESFKFVAYTCVMLDILPIFSKLSKSFPVRQSGLRQDELSDVCDEENHESVYKTTISKLFATMSDHSSVKKF